MKRFIPLAVFVGLVAMMAWSLTRDEDRYIPSALVGRPIPALTLEPIVTGKPGVRLPQPGGPRLVNIFASWCVPCIAEAPLLAELGRRGAVIDGIALRDRPGAVSAFLDRNGDPFARIGSDPESAAQIALGASGVPETFVVDGEGIIRYHHVGPIEAADLPRIMSELERVK